MNDWKEEEIEFLKNNYNLLSWQEIAKKTGRTRSAIFIKAKRLGLKKDEKYNYDYKFFDSIDNEYKAYWLGFFLADGYVVYNKENRNYELSIEINVKDKTHLEKFNKHISGNLNVMTRIRKPRVIKGVPVPYTNSCYIRLFNKHMVDSIIKCGCVPKKSKTIGLPDINDDLMRHLIRGLFDGDGSICSTRYMCDITTASQNMINDVSKFLNKNGIRFYVSPNRSNSDCFKIGMTGKDNVIKFLNLIYSDSNISLDRKFNLYKKKIATLHSDM